MAERYDALTVRESNGKSYFTKIGAMFPNRTGSGFTLVLDAVPGSMDGQYRILLKEPQERDAARGNGGSGNASKGRAGNDDLDDDGIPYMRSDGLF
jgi:hypothetical protein